MTQQRHRIFIVGVPRSGTTLIQSMLNAHPDIVSFPESHFFSFMAYDINWLMYGPLAPRTVSMPRAQFRQLRGKIATLRGRANPAVKKRIEMFLTRAGVEHENARFSDLPDRIAPLSQAFVELLDELAGERHWVEKTPMHLFRMKMIETYVPNARFIHVIRKGEDVLGSIMDATQRYPQWAARHLDGENTIPRLIALWNRSVSTTLSMQGRKNHLIVSYEDLTTTPPIYAGKFVDFLELSRGSAMTRIDTSTIVAKDEEPWKMQMGQEIKKRPSKFTSVFSPAERNQISKKLIKVPVGVFS